LDGRTHLVEKWVGYAEHAPLETFRTDKSQLREAEGDLRAIVRLALVVIGIASTISLLNLLSIKTGRSKNVSLPFSSTPTLTPSEHHHTSRMCTNWLKPDRSISFFVAFHRSKSFAIHVVS
jgi:hypothetical protein